RSGLGGSCILHGWRTAGLSLAGGHGGGGGAGNGVAGRWTRARPRTCSTGHLPPEIPRPAPRGVHARGCRQVFGLTGPEGRGLPPPPPLPGALAPVLVAGSFPITAAGQCRTGARGASPASLLIRPAAAGPNRRPQGSGVGRLPSTHILCTARRRAPVWPACLPAGPAQGGRPQPRCSRARYSAPCISTRREDVRSNAAARRSPA